jgi:hypothetical protein
MDGGGAHSGSPFSPRAAASTTRIGIMVVRRARRGKVKRAVQNYIFTQHFFWFKFDLHHGQLALASAKIGSPHPQTQLRNP